MMSNNYEAFAVLYFAKHSAAPQAHCWRRRLFSVRITTVTIMVSENFSLQVQNAPVVTYIFYELIDFETVYTVDGNGSVSTVNMTYPHFGRTMPLQL